MDNQNKQEQMNEIAGEAIMATREGKINWEKSTRNNTFQTVISKKPANLMDLEIHQEKNTKKIKLTIKHNGNLVKSFHPDQQEELQEIMEYLHKNILKEDEKIQWALEQLKKLRKEETEKTTVTNQRWTIYRIINALDESKNEYIELEVQIRFLEPKGNSVNWEFWENALDYFLEYDNLSEFVQDTDYWHEQTDFLLTGSAFRFNLDRVDLQEPNLILDGKAIRYIAQETMRGDLMTLTDKNSIVSQVKFEIWFSDRDQARPILAQMIHNLTPNHPTS